MNDLKNHLEKFNLIGKNAVVTGGAGLLGVEHARAILSANGNVVLWDLNSSQLSDVSTELKNEFGKERVLPLVVDVTDENQISTGLKKLIEEDIEIHILVNNVAANPKYSSFDSQSNFSRLENF